MNHQDNDTSPQGPIDVGPLGRRGFLRIGGLSVALAAVVAACNNTEAGHLGRIGVAPPTTKLPDAPLTDVALLRTCASLQRSLLEVYNKVVNDPDLLDPANQPLVQRLIADADASAKLFDQLTTEAGGEPWPCGNSKFDSVLINPAYERITVGTPATPEAPAIPASDDKRRDILTLVHGMESTISATYQQYVTLLSKPPVRATTLTVGVRNARHAALLAIVINPDRPGGYVSSEEQSAAQVATADTSPGSTPTTTPQDLGNTTTTKAPSGGNVPTPIVPPSAIPSTFGSTATLQIVVGAGDENGTRLKLNLETPSLNSLEYEYLTPDCTPAT
ncbi:MAG: hypothetical protein JWM12_1439 [Ilumatobacteraceae bacterium]|nr:hypothetical protein [Ilumatobacteraceae bacterium]